jgi:hypothetical protein
MESIPHRMQAACKSCGVVTLHILPSEDDLELVFRALSGGSNTLAAAELKHIAGCSGAEAKTWLDHLLNCAAAWPTAEADEAILKRVHSAFESVPKPEHFTDYIHCCECNEHNDVLRAATRETIKREALGSMGWDPITFSSAEGIAYYFPMLARFALLPDFWTGQYDWYGVQILWCLARDGKENQFLKWCSSAQRDVAYAFIEHMATTRGEAIKNNCASDEELQAALSAWAP